MFGGGRCRGQSEVTATILLTAMFVLLASIVGYYVLSNVSDDDTPVVELDGEVTHETVRLTHGGGDRLDASTLTVVVRYDGAEQRYDFEADGTAGDDDGTFEPGERWTLDGTPPYAAGDTVEVLLLDTDGGHVLLRVRRQAVTPSPTPSPAPSA